MEWVKTTAKTLPEAIDLALDNLGVDEAEAEIVIVEEPKPGLFGRTRGTARVEARVKPKAIRPKVERGRNRRNRSEGGGGRSGDRNRNRNRNRSEKGQSKSQDGSRSKETAAPDSGGDSEKPSSSEGAGTSGGRRRSRSRGGRSNRSGQTNSDRAQSNQSNKPSAASETKGGGQRPRRQKKTQEKARSVEPSKEASMEEVSTQLRTFLTDLTEAFGFDSDVTIDDSEEDTLVGKIEGQHGLLVGPKGRTLDAVQELARISCQRATPSSIRIKVDVGGYRQQRTEALSAFALAAAENAITNATEVALDPMSAADRKVIHDALNETEGVETRSVGTEPRRKVLVVPVATDEDAAVDDAVSDEVEGTDVNGNGQDEVESNEDLESAASGDES